MYIYIYICIYVFNVLIHLLGREKCQGVFHSCLTCVCRFKIKQEN